MLCFRHAKPYILEGDLSPGIGRRQAANVGDSPPHETSPTCLGGLWRCSHKAVAFLFGRLPTGKESWVFASPLKSLGLCFPRQAVIAGECVPMMLVSPMFRPAGIVWPPPGDRELEPFLFLKIHFTDSCIDKWIVSISVPSSPKENPQGK